MKRSLRAGGPFALPGYASFTDVGLDGHWVSPYQIAAGSFSGPVLLTYNYLDEVTARREHDRLRQLGYLPEMPFNRVLDIALEALGAKRGELYVTHAFHLLPKTRSEAIPASDLDQSFEAIARLELEGRPVLALGQAAARLCRRHGLEHVATPHLSARGLSFAARADILASALKSVL